MSEVPCAADYIVSALGIKPGDRILLLWPDGNASPHYIYEFVSASGDWMCLDMVEEDAISEPARFMQNLTQLDGVRLLPPGHFEFAMMSALKTPHENEKLMRDYKAARAQEASDAGE